MNRYAWWIVCALASAGVAVAETPARKTFLDYCKGQATPAEARVVELLRIEVGLTECAAVYAALQKRERIDLAMKDITTVAPLVGLDALVELNIAFNDIQDLAPMGTLRNLRTLNINSLRASSLDALRSLKLLEELFVISAVKDIDVVADLPQLRVLNIEYAQVTDLSPLSKATNLRVLRLGNNEWLVDLSPLGNLRALEELHLNGPTGVKTLESIARLTSLRELHVHGGPALVNVDAVAGMKNLEQLTLVLGAGAKLPALAGHTKLKVLHVEHGALVDLTPLAGATSIEVLYLDNNRIQSIEPLRTLVELRTARLSRNRIADFSPLASATKLVHVELGANRIIKDEAHCPTDVGAAVLTQFCGRLRGVAMSDEASVGAAPPLPQTEARARQIDERRELLAPGGAESGCHEGGSLRGFKDGALVVKLDAECYMTFGRERWEVYFERDKPFFVRLTGRRYVQPMASHGRTTPIDERITLVDGKIAGLVDKGARVTSKKAIAAHQATLDKTLSWLGQRAEKIDWGAQRPVPAAVDAIGKRWQATMDAVPELSESTRPFTGCTDRTYDLRWWSDAKGTRRIRLERDWKGSKNNREVFLDDARPYFLFIEASRGGQLEEATRDYLEGGHVTWRLSWTSAADGPRGVQTKVSPVHDEAALWTIEKLMRLTSGTGAYPCEDVGE